MEKPYILVAGEVPASVIGSIKKNYVGEILNIQDLVPALMHLLGDHCLPETIVLGDHIKIGEGGLRLSTEEFRPVFARLAKIHNCDLYLGCDKGELMSLDFFEKMHRI